MNKDTAISQMAEVIEGYEAAIQDHPPQVSQEYFRGLEPFLAGAAKQSTAPRYIPLDLSENDVVTFNRLIFSSSFISAWYHLNRDKQMRNKATNACIMMVSSLGLEPDILMPRYVKMEQHWRRTLRAKGVGKRSKMMIAAIAAVIAAIIWAVVSAVS